MKLLSIIIKFNKGYREMTIAARAIIWFSFCNFITRAFSLVTLPLYTRILSENEYGILTIYISYEQLMVILATWELYLGGYQKGIVSFEEKKEFTVSTIGLTNIITISFFAFFFLFQNAIRTIINFPNVILILLFFDILFLPAYQCWLIQKRTSYEYISVSAVTILYSFAITVIPIVLLLLLKKTANLKYISGLILNIIFYATFYFRTLYKNLTWIKFKNIIKYWGFLLKFQGPLVFHALSFMILNQADRIMIGEMVGTDKAAFYSVAYNLTSVISILHVSINQVFTPWRYKKIKDGRFDDINRTTNYLLLFVCAIIVMFIMLAPEAMKLLFPREYYEAIWCIPPIACSIYFIFLYTIFVNVEAFYDQTKYIMYVSVICGMINIILNYFSINYFGYISAGYTTLISYIIFSFAHYHFMRKVCKKYLSNIKIFSTKIIVLVSTFLIVISLLSAIIYRYCLLRIIVFITIFVVLLFGRQKIKRFWLLKS